MYRMCVLWGTIVVLQYFSQVIVVQVCSPDLHGRSLNSLFRKFPFV